MSKDITGRPPLRDDNAHPSPPLPPLPVRSALAAGLPVRLLALRFISPGARGTLRRFLVLFALLFWQGGFLFYSAVVIPVGRSELPNPAMQSLVTMPATRYLNFIGGVALVLLVLDVFLT